ncbi:MAG: sulfatase-like hydrolase/transferase [Adhaeribacter sp.]
MQGRIQITIGIVLAILLFSNPEKSQAQNKPRQPNILWITSEDNNPLLGAYGDAFATTPNLDKLASQGVRYLNAFTTAPVCAPSRCTLITGMYPSGLGTENMRSTYPIPEAFKFFPHYLRQAGYYTTNNVKKDYNTVDQREAWNESSGKATYKNRKPGQPFFAVFNLTMTHESSLHKPVAQLQHDPEKVPMPPYHPRTKEMEHDWAQYYDKVTAMDAQAGKLLQELEEAGLADSTIVFYYSDHGGVLARSKRFIFDSGLRVPLIIRFPKAFAHLAPGKPGSSTDRLVSFVDFAPTILALAGLPAPPNMQGQAFLGLKQPAPRQYAYSSRARIDERLDLVRSVRDKQYRYVRNYLPHRIYGQHVDYLWQAPSIRSWEAAFRAGKLSPEQSLFWQPKPSEELYDVAADPHNIRNLAADPQYKGVLARLRAANSQWLLQNRDAGFIPEAMMAEISQTTTLHAYARSSKYPLERVLETADMASSRDPKMLATLSKRLSDPAPVVRYWAATGCIVLGAKAAPARAALRKLLADPEPAVRLAAAEALSQVDRKEQVLPILTKALQSDNLLVRVQALNVLEYMGQEAAGALPAVKDMLQQRGKNGEYDFRAARWLISKLENGNGEITE